VSYLDGDGKRRELPGHAAAPALQQVAPVTCRRDQRPERARALRAFQEAGRTDSCAIMGQNASPEGRAELRQPGTRLVGSVAYFPEKYGAEIVAVALDILHRKAVPPAVFVEHQLVTPDTVNHIYPNDELMITPELSA
jgi:ribose transport system substrate-binding protein